VSVEIVAHLVFDAPRLTDDDAPLQEEKESSHIEAPMSSNP